MTAGRSAYQFHIKKLAAYAGELAIYAARQAPDEKFISRVRSAGASYAYVTFGLDKERFMVSPASLTLIRDIIELPTSTLDAYKMGFDYNPFRHIEIVETNSTDELTGAPIGLRTFEWYCHNCGGQSSSKGKTWQIDALQGLLEDWEQHLKGSHRKTRFDLKKWSDL